MLGGVWRELCKALICAFVAILNRLLSDILGAPYNGLLIIAE